jgi:DNA polymerase III subunit delta
MPAPLSPERLQGPLPPLILLLGEEDYLLEACLARILAHAVEPSLADFNCDVLHGEDLKGEELFVLAAAYPMMADRRLVAVRAWDKAPASVQEDMASYCAAPSASTCLVLCARSLDRRRKSVKTLLAAAEVHEFKTPTGAALLSWMKDWCSGRGRELPQESAQRLAERFEGAPLRLVAQELEKLALLSPEDGRIEPELLATAIGLEAGADAFALNEAILARRPRQALAILGGLLRNPETLHQALAVQVRLFGRLWFALQLKQRRLDDRAIAEALALNPWALRKQLGAASSWTPEQAAAACRELRETDLALKGGSALDEGQLMTGTVLRLCRPTTSP